MNVCACECEHVQLVPSKVHFTWTYSVPAMFALNEAHETHLCVCCTLEERVHAQQG